MLTTVTAQNSDNPSTEPTTRGVGGTLDSTREALQTLELMERGLTPAGNDVDLDFDLNNPELPQSSDAGPQTATSGSDSESRKLQREQWERENWLVAAMYKQSDETESAKRDESPDSGTFQPNTNQWLVTALAAQETAEANAAAEQADDIGEVDPANQVANPFAPFLESWMKTDDLALLRDFGAMEPAQNESLSTEVLGDRHALELTSRDSFGDTSAAAATPDTNPYLATFDVELDDTPALGPALQLPQVRTRAPTVNLAPTGVLFGSTPANVPSAPITPPEENAERDSRGWKPPEQTDKKYFPRLNRF